MERAENPRSQSVMQAASLIRGAFAGLIATVIAAGAIADGALARTASGGTDSGLGACQRAVSRIGAEMSHRLDSSAAGEEIYLFIVRGHGGEYSVRCDGRTGSLGAVDRLARSGDAEGE